MRTLFVFMNISLDGYFEGPDHDISYFHNDFEAFSAEASHHVDTLLFGRKTYEIMKFWSTPEGRALHPGIAAFMTDNHKYVASRSTFDPGWKNVTLISGDVVGEVQKLKSQPGGAIAVFGSNALCASLMEKDLIDLLQILVNPIVLGDGTSLLASLPGKVKLTLKEARPFKSGAVLLSYQPTA